ncbi:MAG TPA: glycosyltransferase family 4 protein [Terriglobales bacterium]
MRILLVSDDPADITVGASQAPLRLQEQLRELGHDCDCLFREDLGARPRSERLRYAVSPWLARQGARRAWRERGPYDVIDAASAEAGPMAAARRGGEFAGAVVVARSHGLDHIYYRGLIQDGRAGLISKPWWRRVWYPAARLRQTERAFRLADGGILLNRRERLLALHRGWQPPERLAVIPHGVPMAGAGVAPPAEATRGAGALFCGAWHTGKGIHYLAEAHRRLITRGIAARLTILGPGIGGEWGEVERWVRSAFVEVCQPWLTVLPRVDSVEAVFDQYRRHDLLLCPSTAEGFAMVTFEALSQRLPVVMSRAVGAGDWLQHGEHVLKVPSRDAAALADGWQLLLENAALGRRLAEAGRRRVLPFTWRRAAEQTLAFYASLGAATTAGAATAAGRK